MDAVGELLTERSAMAVLAGIAVLAAFVLLCRARRVSTSMEDATLTALHRVTDAAPTLREGLSVRSADELTPHLKEMLGCVAVALTDGDGEVLSWAGEANYHYEDLRPTVEKAIIHRTTETTSHGMMDCDVNKCALRHAIVAPLEVDGIMVGSLLVASAVGGRRLSRAAEVGSRYITTHLELAELEESRSRLAIAEVRALRAQISPHFLYNALTTISSLVRTDQEQARDLLLDFADFTRYSFRTAGEFTTLGEELHNVERYLTLERARYGDALNAQVRIAPEVLSVAVPFLTLQPLVENAVRHGLANKPGGGTVTVVAADNGAEATISVEDDGVGMDPERLSQDLNSHFTGAHVGINNIDHRLRSFFGNDYGLVVETNLGAGTKISMRVPKFTAGVHAPPPTWPDAVGRKQEEAHQAAG
ncbi:MULTISPECIES: sensor histidine kinase [Crossiella]|uniref:sensor histidine kinase n=1 Tax=Crossiella TaxID=130795 RepID=UPI001611A9AE|nr:MULTISPECIES: histidine kinase [Crossiella]MCK2237482.1 histidine kinase [Crossiella sp. S99.2]MCK2254768.1 histidine kinase [Crossiella sp. S99.1]